MVDIRTRPISAGRSPCKQQAESSQIKASQTQKQPHCENQYFTWRFERSHIYVHQSDGFEKVNESHKVYKLLKALYGLKQAWNINPDGFLNTLKFHLCVREQDV